MDKKTIEKIYDATVNVFKLGLICTISKFTNDVSKLQTQSTIEHIRFDLKSIARNTNR